MRLLVAVVVAGCATGPDVPTTPKKQPPPVVTPADAQVASPDGAVADDRTWLRGTTHVHAKPSGDSSEPLESVEAWYEQRGYDFIILTDHNRVTIAPLSKLIVIPGIELTMNPARCEPPGDGTCRIHINALGVTARPEGKLDWPDRSVHDRVTLYANAIAEATKLGASVVQINHPNWHWGMTPELLTDVGKRGVKLVEIANSQFTKWNVGDPDHPSTEVEWDAALAAGVTMWGVASDDAHDYHADGSGKYPAGGGWVVVKARRDPQSILDALATGAFYSSNGVTLTRAEVTNGELVIDVDPETSRTYTITFIENGKPVATTTGLSGHYPVPQSGYLRAVITRDDGKQAWVQPVRRTTSE